MKWLCFGAGALGTYLGGSLALAGEQVVFLERPPAAAELRRRGLRLDFGRYGRDAAGGQATIQPSSLIVEDSLEAALLRGPFDVAIYALKSFDTPAALEGMAPFAPQLPPVCCFSNGVDNEAAIAALLGTDRVIAASVTTAIGRRGPGDIVVEKLRGVGVGNSQSLAGQIVDSANAAFLRARLFSNPLAMKWSKLLTNLLANPTSAILDMTAAQIFANPQLYRLEVGMLRECLAVMRAQNLPVVDLPGVPVRLLTFAIRLPLWVSKPFLARAAGGGRGGKMPSFHIDLHSGRGQSEVEYLHGAVVRAGEKCGVPTPINSVLTEILMALTLGKQSPEAYAHQPRKLLAALEAGTRTP